MLLDTNHVCNKALFFSGCTPSIKCHVNSADRHVVDRFSGKKSEQLGLPKRFTVSLSFRPVHAFVFFAAVSSIHLSWALPVSLFSFSLIAISTQMVSALWKACSVGDLENVLDLLKEVATVDIEIKGMCRSFLTPLCFVTAMQSTLAMS